MVQVFRCGASWGAYPLVSVLPAADVSHLAAGVEKQRRQPSELCAAETEAAARWIIATESTDISLSVGCFYFAMNFSWGTTFCLCVGRQTLCGWGIVEQFQQLSLLLHAGIMMTVIICRWHTHTHIRRPKLSLQHDSRFKKLCCLSHNDRRLPSKSSNNTTNIHIQSTAIKSHNREWKRSCKLSFAGLGAAEGAVTGCEESSVLQTSFLSECWVYAVLVIWSCMFEDQ